MSSIESKKHDLIKQQRPKMSRSYEFVQLDVFTKTSLTGNPLAIFTDGRGLTDQQMQALAREMNLSETTFILPRDPATEAQEGKKVRIFTVAEELPFAGHPTLGTALYLHSTAVSGADEIILDLKAGKIPTEWPIQIVSTGLPFAIVGIRNEPTLANLNFLHAQAAEFLKNTDAKFF